MYAANGEEGRGSSRVEFDRIREKPVVNPVIGAAGKLISFVFHPLFIPFYITCFLVFLHPFAFSGMPEKTKVFRAISVFMLTAFFPAFTVFLLKQLKFVGSVMLDTQKDRIIPYVASMFFYFWVFYVSKNLTDSSPLFVKLLLGVFISSIVSLMANIYFKISMHGMAMGVLLTFFVIVALQGNMDMGVYLTLAIIVAGLVCSARLLVSDHYPFEVYAGLVLGIVSQVMGNLFV